MSDDNIPLYHNHSDGTYCMPNDYGSYNKYDCCANFLGAIDNIDDYGYMVSFSSNRYDYLEKQYLDFKRVVYPEGNYYHYEWRGINYIRVDRGIDFTDVFEVRISKGGKIKVNKHFMCYTHKFNGCFPHFILRGRANRSYWLFKFKVVGFKNVAKITEMNDDLPEFNPAFWEDKNLVKEYYNFINPDGEFNE